MSDIRTRPATPEYRSNWDRIFNPNGRQTLEEWAADHEPGLKMFKIPGNTRKRGAKGRFLKTRE